MSQLACETRCADGTRTRSASTVHDVKFTFTQCKIHVCLVCSRSSSAAEECCSVRLKLCKALALLFSTMTAQLRTHLCMSA